MQENIFILQRWILKYLGGKCHGCLQLNFHNGSIKGKRVECVYTYLCRYILFC